MKILVCSDFHGNYQHARACLQACREHPPDVFVYLGDLCPMRTRFPDCASAGKYVEEHIFPYFRYLSVSQKFVMCGNTDFRPLIEKWKAYYRHQTDGFVFLENSSLRSNGIYLLFLSTTESCKHALKDNEAMSKVNPVFANEYVFSGRGSYAFKTQSGMEYSSEFVKFGAYSEIDEEYRQRFSHTIYELLDENFSNCEKSIIFSHSPPYGTIDEAKSGHLGSHDLRRFIEEHRILACFAGHIHGGVERNGDYHKVLNKCLILCPGGSGVDTEYAQIVNFIGFDTATDEYYRFSYAVEAYEHTFSRYK